MSEQVIQVATRRETSIALLITSVFGIYWFSALGLWPFVNPTHIDWMIEGDWMGHLFGWLFSRSAPWGIPLAQAPQLLAPHGSSAALTDAIPLMSVIAKFFSPFFGPRFQPFGIWMLSGIIGTGIAGILSMRAHLKDWFSLAAIGILFVINPIVSTRYGHPPFFGLWSLVGLVGAAFWPIATGLDARKLLRNVFILLALACATNAYLSVMASGVAFAVVIRIVAIDKKLSLKESLLWLGATPLASLATLYLFGFIAGLQSSPLDTLAIEGFGQFSADILAFVNPLEWSRFLKPIQIGGRQYEGFSYLGLGIIGLCVVALVQLVRHRELFRRTIWLSPVLFVSLVMAFYALSNFVTIRGQLIADFSSLYAHMGKWPSVFRSSGRFVWPLHSFITIGSVIMVSRMSQVRVRQIFLGAAALIQFADFNPGHVPFNGKPIAPFVDLKDPAWKLMNQGYKHVIMHPIQIQWTCPFDGPLVAKLSWEAFQQGLTVNSGHVGRAPAGTDCNKHLTPSELKSDAVYVVYFQQFFSDFQNAGFVCGPIEGIMVCVDPKNDTPLKQWIQNHSS